MDTKTAAAKANVTTATIRTWCRLGAITAAKTSGRWDIDETSLTHRIALSAKPHTPHPLDAEAILALGGNRWQRNGMDRVYLNDWAKFAGIEIDRYGTGNISSAAIDGEPIANSRIGGILGSVSRVYFDAADGKLHIQHQGASAIDVRYLDGQRDTLNLVQRIFDGIKTAAATL